MKPSLPLFVASALLAAIPTPSQAQIAVRGEPIAFDKLKVDPKEWTRKDEPMVFGEAKLPVTVETPHFLIGVDAKINNSLAGGYAEGLERIWLDLRQNLPVMDEAFAGKKMLIVLIESRPQMINMRDYYGKVAEKNNWYREAMEVQDDWEEYGVITMKVDPALQKERSLLASSRVFQTSSYPSGRQRDPSWNTRVHFVTGSLRANLLEDVSFDGVWMWGPLLMGMDYYFEWHATGRTESEVQFSNSDREVELFKGGRSWATAVKKMVKDGVEPSLKKMLTGRASEAHPGDVGLAFSLLRFVTADPERRKGFDAAFRHLRKTKKFCDAHAFASHIGYDSPEALEADWKKYIGGLEFR